MPMQYNLNMFTWQMFRRTDTPFLPQHVANKIHELSYSGISHLDSKYILPHQPSSKNAAACLCLTEALMSTPQPRVVVQQNLGCMQAGLGSLWWQVEQWAVPGPEASEGTLAGRV